MPKVIRLNNIILSRQEPASPHVLWGKPINGGISLLIYNKGKWEPLDFSGTTEEISLEKIVSKLNGIETGAEVNVQSNWEEEDNTSDAYIQNKPAIPTKVSELENDSGFVSSTSPLEQIQADWEEADTTSKAYILNKPTYSTGLTIGNSDEALHLSSYVDNNNKPIKATFSSGDGEYSDGVVAELDGNDFKLTSYTPSRSEEGQGHYVITVNMPTKTSDLTNDSSFATEDYVSTSVANIVNGAPEAYDTLKEIADWIAKDETSTAELVTKVNGIEEGAQANVHSDWTEEDPAYDSYIENKPTLATVATSGSYNDLTDKPTIPDGVDLTGYATETWVEEQNYLTSVPKNVVGSTQGYTIAKLTSSEYEALTTKDASTIYLIVEES